MAWSSGLVLGGGDGFAGYVVEMLEAATDGGEEAAGGGGEEEVEGYVVIGVEVGEEVGEGEFGGVGYG